MPYIDKELREVFAFAINMLIEDCHTRLNPGKLNYIITKLCIELINKFGENYHNYNAIIGVLECVKLELYRRKIALYENEKCKLNGDVYI